MGLFTQGKKDSITYTQKDRTKIEIPFVYVVYYFVLWKSLSRDERKKKFVEMMIAGKFGAGVNYCQRILKEYNPMNPNEKDDYAPYENAFSNAFILASLPNSVLPERQRCEDGDKKWKIAFGKIRSKGNVPDRINKIIWADVPEECKEDDVEFFNKTNALLAFGIGSPEQLEAFEDKRKVAREKQQKKYVEAKGTFIACMCDVAKNGLCRCKTTLNGIKGGSASEVWFNSVTRERVRTFDEETRKTCVNGKCLFVECKCEGGSKCRCETTRNGIKGGNASELWFDEVTGKQVPSFDEESRKTCVNGKCLFVECKGGRNCRCKKGPDGNKGGNANEMWYDILTGKQVTNFDEEARKTCVNAKCIFVECMCEGGSKCRCETTRNGIKGGNASEVWYDILTGKRVYTFDEESRKTCVNGKCLFVECKGGRNCRCKKGPDGNKGGNANEMWYDILTGKQVTNFDEEARKTCVNAKCIFVECHCGKKSGCRCKTTRFKTTRFIGLKRVKGDTANGMWFDESGERLYSFPKGTKAINARCIQRVCAGLCGRTGYASTINNKSPLLEKGEEYLCRDCATLDVFTDARGCPFCGKRWTGCSTEPNDMQFCMDRDKTRKFWESEGKIGLLDRTAHMNCWRETHNEMLKLRDVEKEKNIGMGVSLQDKSKKIKAIKAMIKGEMKKILDADANGTLKRTFEAAKEEGKKKENERKSAREALANEYAVKLKELMTKEPDQK